MTPPTTRSPQGTKGTSTGSQTDLALKVDSESAKRKSSLSPKTLTTTGTFKEEDGETAGLKCLLSTLKTAMHEASLVGKTTKDMHVHDLLKQMFGVLVPLIENRKARDARPAAKKSKVSECSEAHLDSQTAETSARIPLMVDSSTDMTLTPHWWDSEKTREAEHRSTKASKVKTVNTKAKEAKPTTTPYDTGAESAMDTDGGAWTINRSKKLRKQKTTALTTQATPVPPRTAKLAKKPPAVEVKVIPGMTFADTVREVRINSGVNIADLGAPVKSMRQTRGGNLIMEFERGAKAEAAAVKLRSLLTAKIADKVGNIFNLGTSSEIEIVDIDAVAEREEIEAALDKAVKEKFAGSDDNIGPLKLSGLWTTRSGQQIATVKVPKSIAEGITRLPIGWTMCRVRPRTQQPTRCYKCHGFGHISGSCQGPDLTKACRRCGETGHVEKECTTESCVACQRLGGEYVPHKPGTARCKARKEAESGRSTQ